MSLSTPATVLSGLRLAVGVSSWATPNLAAQAFGLKPEDNPAGPYLARLFGIRDVVLGIGPGLTTDKARRQWLQAGLVCDVADIAAAALAGRSGGLSRTSAILAGGTAAVAVGLGVVALWSEDSDPTPDGAATV